LGVIGAGSWTVSSHLPNLAVHREEVEFTIVNRRNPDLLARIRDKFGFQTSTTDWRDVIDARPDIVVVGSPPGYHWEHTKAALEAGAHVMCEKPFTLDPAHAWDLDQTARRTGRHLIIAYGWNFRPMVIQAHRLMREDGGVGEIEHVALHMDSVTRELLSETGYYPAADPETIPQADTWSRPETSGGGYGQAQLTHLLGVSLWLTGLRGQDVFALMSAPLGARVELHDAVVMRYTNGAIGTMSGASSHLGGANNRHAVEVRVVGSRGMFHLDLRENLLWRYRGSGDDVRVPLDADAGLYDCKGPIDALVEAGAGRPFANNAPAELGARTVEILEAAYRSAASGALERVKTLDAVPV
jgi:predicted dehydrogenase